MPPPAPACSSEFDLIARHFLRNRPLRHAALGVGDDCALLQPPPGQQLASSTDTLVAGCHFFGDVAPEALAHKALAVNLSDLAACGARPLAFTLALTLPEANDAWLAAFARGLFALADASGCELIGGDTTRGPLSINITVFGSTPPGQALLRSGAQAGDDIYVSHGNTTGLGDARLALHLLQVQRALAVNVPAVHALPSCARASLLHTVRPQLEHPTPRLALGLALRGLASSCLDLSDGLAGDIRHILAASHTGATLYAAHADGGGLLAATSAALRTLGEQTALDYALAGGDDYELLLTAAPQHRHAIAQTAAQCQLQLTRIGHINAQAGLRWTALDSTTHPLQNGGFDHFAATGNGASSACAAPAPD